MTHGIRIPAKNKLGVSTYELNLAVKKTGHLQVAVELLLVSWFGDASSSTSLA